MDLSLKGTTGFLLLTEAGPVFRIYDKNYEFKDYKIAHNDLMITIQDIDATIYPSEDYDGTIDYSPATLGIEE